MTIEEMIKQLEKCYLCLKERECINCVYNHYKLSIIIYLLKQQKKFCEHRREMIDKTNKEENRLKVEYKLDEIRLYLNNNLHPLVSPNNWQVYSDLVDMIDELGELLSNE